MLQSSRPEQDACVTLPMLKLNWPPLLVVSFAFHPVSVRTSLARVEAFTQDNGPTSGTFARSETKEH